MVSGDGWVQLLRISHSWIGFGRGERENLQCLFWDKISLRWRPLMTISFIYHPHFLAVLQWRRSLPVPLSFVFTFYSITKSKPWNLKEDDSCDVSEKEKVEEVKQRSKWFRRSPSLECSWNFLSIVFNIRLMFTSPFWNMTLFLKCHTCSHVIAAMICKWDSEMLFGTTVVWGSITCCTSSKLEEALQLSILKFHLLPYHKALITSRSLNRCSYVSSPTLHSGQLTSWISPNSYILLHEILLPRSSYTL